MYLSREDKAVLRTEKAEAITKELVKALKEAKIKHSTYKSNNFGNNRTHIRLENTMVVVEVDIDRARPFDSEINKGRIKVQSPRRFERTKQFPERKNGFDYKAITDYISKEIESEKEMLTLAEKAKVDHENADQAEDDLKEKYKAFIPNRSWYSLFVVELKPSGSVHVNHSGGVDKFKIEISGLSVEMADKILEILTDKFGEICNKDDQES